MEALGQGLPSISTSRAVGNNSWTAWCLSLTQHALHAVAQSTSLGLPWMRTPTAQPSPPASPAYSTMDSADNASASTTTHLCPECSGRQSQEESSTPRTPPPARTPPHPRPAQAAQEECSSLAASIAGSDGSSMASTTGGSNGAHWRWWSRQPAGPATAWPHGAQRSQGACAKCGRQLPSSIRLGSHANTSPQPTSDVSSWLQNQSCSPRSARNAATAAAPWHAPHERGQQAAWGLIRRATGPALLFALKAVALTAAARKALPPSKARGSTKGGTLARASLLLVGVRWLLQKQGVAQAEQTEQTVEREGGQSAQQLLELPHMASWLSEDVARRLLAQAEQDVQAARARAASIHTWRLAAGLDCIVYPPPSTAAAPAGASPAEGAPTKQPGRTGSHRFSWYGGPQRQATQQPCAGEAVPVSERSECPAAAAAARFGLLAELLGASLAHVDQQQGLAVLWVQGSRLQGVRAALCALHVLGPEAARAPGKGQEAPWLGACALQAALMSEWLWRVRLPDQPVEAGRYVQVVDLKGLRLSSALTEGLAVLRSIMAAGHNFPQRLKANIIINPPPGLALAWGMIAALLPQAVVAKIRIVRGGPAAILQELSRWMPKELIPAAYGGHCTLPLGQYPAQQELQAAMKGARCLPASP